MVFDIVSSTLSSPLLEEKTELDEQLGTPGKPYELCSHGL